MTVKEIMDQAVTEVNAGNLGRGLILVNLAINLDPLDCELFHFRGLVNANLKKYVEAIVDYKKAISINPNVFQFHYNLGNVYMDLKQYDMAIECYTKSSNLCPGDLEIIANRGMCYLKNAQYGEARIDFDHVLKSDSSNRVAVYGKNMIDILGK
jgi:tetratricopeptide (TPR) repeat protein